MVLKMIYSIPIIHSNKFVYKNSMQILFKKIRIYIIDAIKKVKYRLLQYEIAKYQYL